MRIGQKVLYAKGSGKPTEMEIVAYAAENGASGFKRLDLTDGKKVVKDVPHEGDAEKGDGYWTL